MFTGAEATLLPKAQTQNWPLYSSADSAIPHHRRLVWVCCYQSRNLQILVFMHHTNGVRVQSGMMGG